MPATDTFAVMLRIGQSWEMRGEKMAPFGEAANWADLIIGDPKHDEVRVIRERDGFVARKVRRETSRLCVYAACLTCKQEMNLMTSPYVPCTMIAWCEQCYRVRLRVWTPEDLAPPESEDRHEKRNTGSEDSVRCP